MILNWKSILLCTLCAMLFLACENKDENKNKSESTDTLKNKQDTLSDETAPQSKAIEYQLIANDFIKVFNQKDIKSLDKFLHPDCGLFILNNPGAFIVVSHFKDFNEAMKNDWGPAMKDIKISGTITPDDLPYFDCETNDWNVKGLILTENPSVKLLDFYNSGIEFELYPKDEKILKSITIFEPQIVFSVYDTNETIGLFFAQVGGKWYLIYIDRIDPCSA